MSVHIPITLLWLAGSIALTVFLAIVIVAGIGIYLYFTDPKFGVIDEDF